MQKQEIFYGIETINDKNFLKMLQNDWNYLCPHENTLTIVNNVSIGFKIDKNTYDYFLTTITKQNLDKFFKIYGVSCVFFVKEKIEIKSIFDNNTNTVNTDKKYTILKREKREKEENIPVKKDAYKAFRSYDRKYIRRKKYKKN